LFLTPTSPPFVVNHGLSPRLPLSFSFLTDPPLGADPLFLIRPVLFLIPFSPPQSFSLPNLFDVFPQLREFLFSPCDRFLEHCFFSGVFPPPPSSTAPVFSTSPPLQHSPRRIHSFVSLCVFPLTTTGTALRFSFLADPRLHMAFPKPWDSHRVPAMLWCGVPLLY